jgi:hypothetical protein
VFEHQQAVAEQEPEAFAVEPDRQPYQRAAAQDAATAAADDRRSASSDAFG